MKIIALILMNLMPIVPAAGAFGLKDTAADDPVIEIFDRYEEREGVESITISPALLGMMKDGKTNDRKTQDLIAKISGLRILTLSDGHDGKGKANREAFVADLRPVIKKEFEEVMKVKSSGEKVELYIRKSLPDCAECKSALLFITEADASVTVMHLAGKIDKEMIDAVMKGEIGTSKK